jgi:integrase
MPKPIKLTTAGISAAAVEPGKEETKHPIEGHRGAYLRTRRGSSAKPVLLMYRDGTGRQRWIPVASDATAMRPKDIAEAISIKRGELAKGSDLAAARKAEAERQRARLEPALDAWDRDLADRKAVKRSEYVSLLRRELLRPLGNVELTELTVPVVRERCQKVAATRPGAAKELKTRAVVFMGWCHTTAGLIRFNPLAGWRRPRKTKAERLERPGRALEDWELPILWRAADGAGWPFGPYLQMLLLFGQRRSETSLMRWADVDLEAGEWRIPAEVTKSGRLHRVPLPPAAVAILRGLPRQARSPYVFPGRHGAMTGWSKRLPRIYAATAKASMAPWTPHDLRRTMRSGLGRLGVDQTIAELLLNHAISGELRQIYDREEYVQARFEAAKRWADHVLAEVSRVH